MMKTISGSNIDVLPKKVKCPVEWSIVSGMSNALGQVLKDRAWEDQRYHGVEFVVRLRKRVPWVSSLLGRQKEEWKWQIACRDLSDDSTWEEVEE